METSKIGFSNIDNTAFEGRKKKVKKEHPKREKIKENAKKMALFLAGLATLGVATVVITSKTPVEKPVKEKAEETDNNEENIQPQKAEDKKVKVSDKKEDEQTLKYQKALPKPKEVLMLPEHAITADKDDDKKETAANGSKKEQTKEKKIILALPPHIESSNDNAAFYEEPDEKGANQLGTRLEFVVPKSRFEQMPDASDAFDFYDITDGHLEAFIEQYKAAEEAAQARQIEGFREQLDTTSKLLQESVSALEDGEQAEEAEQETDQAVKPFEIKFINIPDIDYILLDMEGGAYGKNMQNTVKYHLDEDAVAIYRTMSPKTIASLSEHFIEMTISKDALGNSNKGMLKRLKGMEKEFTPEGIEKINSTFEGRQRLLRYVVGISDTKRKKLAKHNSFAEKILSKKDEMQAKKENLAWLKKAAEE